MPLSRRIVLIVIAFAACVALACSAKTAPTASRLEIDPRHLYPLQKGNAWSYDVDTGDASTTLAVTRVLAFDGRIAEVQTGDAIVRYEVDAEGIRVPSEDAWLIRAPLREGATWTARGGRTARLASERLPVSTRAGSFDDCVAVLETGGRLELEVRTVFCPGVGPVTVDSTLYLESSDRMLTVSARLRGYQVNPEPDP